MRRARQGATIDFMELRKLDVQPPNEAHGSEPGHRDLVAIVALRGPGR